MSEGGYKIRDQFAMHFVTFQVVYWIDIFSYQHYRDEILNNFRYYRDNQGLRIHAYVIMSNYIHAILSATQAKYDLSSVIGNFKKYTSSAILKIAEQETESRKWWMLRLFAHAAKQHTRNSNRQFWTHNNHPEELNTEDFIRQKLEYIHQNPVRAGIVEKCWRSKLTFQLLKTPLLHFENCL